MQIDGLQDEAKLEERGATQEPPGVLAQVSGDEGGAAVPKVDGGVVQTLADCDELIIELESKIVEALPGVHRSVAHGRDGAAERGHRWGRRVNADESLAVDRRLS